MQKPLVRFHLVAACVCLLNLTGCGGSQPATVSGTVVLPKDLKLEETDTITVRFVHPEVSGKGAVATVSPKNLNFTTKDALPGKYKVVVSVQPYAGTPNVEKRTEAFNRGFNKNFDDKSTPLSYEVTSDPNQSITIDLAAKSISKR